VDIGGCDLRSQRNASTIGHDVTFDAGLAAVSRVWPGRVAALGSLDDRAVERSPLPFGAADVVVELDDLFEQPSKHAGRAPRLKSRVARRS